MKISTIAFSACLALATATAAQAGAGAPGHSHGGKGGVTAFGQPGDPKIPARLVLVTANEGNGEMTFSPSSVAVKTGEQIRFKISNHGELDHEFVIGTPAEIAEHAELMKKFPEMEHEDPSATRMKTKGASEILWKFSKPGDFVFACLIPGHMEGGMIGKIAVK